MKTSEGQTEVFRRGSRTYFTAGLFFPPDVRREVTTLYAFVRVADDYVDTIPQDGEGFRQFRSRYESAWAGEASGDPIVQPFVALARRRGFDKEWVDSFLDAMEADLGPARYETLEETLGYVYGSAEVVGLFMARILGLPPQALPYAQLLGRAMQYINFVRDVDEDLGLGRRYLPLEGTSLPILEREYALAHPDEFSSFVRYHLDLYDGWQAQAEPGIAMIPSALRGPIKTASDMYAWTGAKIRKDPMVVFRQKVKPRKGRIVLRALANAAGV